MENQHQPAEHSQRGFSERLSRVAARWLLLLTSGPRRAVALAVLLAVNGFFAYHYLHIRDNNSVYAMLSPKNSDENFYFNEYLPGFGMDEYIFLAFEVPDALSPEMTKLLASLKEATLQIKLGITADGKPKSDPQTPGRITMAGRIKWPENKDRDLPLIPIREALGCLRPANRLTTWDVCLRRILIPVDVTLESYNGGRSWSITPTQAEQKMLFQFGQATAEQHARQPLQISYDPQSRLASLSPVSDSLTYLDLLPFLGNTDIEQDIGLRMLLSASGRTFKQNSFIPALEGRAVPAVRDYLIGGATDDRMDTRTKYQIVTLRMSLVNLKDRDDLREVAVAYLRNLLRTDKRFAGIKFHVIGAPVVIADNTSQNIATHVTREPASLLLVFLILVLSFHQNLRFVLIPVCTSVAALLTTMGFYGLDIPSIGKIAGEYNWVSSILLVILLFTSIFESIHLLSYYREKLAACVTPEIAFSQTVFTLFIPCFYTSITTAAGLFSIFIFADDGPFRSFGLYGCIGTTLAILYSFLFFALLLPRPARPIQLSDQGERVAEIALNRIFVFIARWRTLLILCTVLLCLVSLSSYRYLTLDADGRRWFDKDAELAQAISFIENRMRGSNSVALVFEERGPGGEELADCHEARARAGIECVQLPIAQGSEPVEVCLGPGQLKGIWAARRAMLPPEGKWTHGEDYTYEEQGQKKNWQQTSHSIVDVAFARPDEGPRVVMQRLQCMLRGGRLQEDGDCDITSAAETVGKQRSATARQLVQFHFNAYHPLPSRRGCLVRTFIVLKQANAASWMTYANNVKASLQKDICAPTQPGQEGGTCVAKLTGSLHVYTQFFSLVLADMWKSFAASITLNWALMILLLWRNRWLAVLSILPSFLPFLLSLSVMVIFDIPLYFATMMIAAVAMGLVIDNTIQFCCILQREIDGLSDEDRRDDKQLRNAFQHAVHRTLLVTGQAMWTSSLSLAIGFSVLLIGDFQAFQHAGRLIVSVILFGLFGDIIVFPALLLLLTRSTRILRGIAG